MQQEARVASGTAAVTFASRYVGDDWTGRVPSVATYGHLQGVARRWPIASLAPLPARRRLLVLDYPTWLAAIDESAAAVMAQGSASRLLSQGRAMRIATFNINRLQERIGVLQAWLEVTQADVMCLQAIECTERMFPLDDLRCGLSAMNGDVQMTTISWPVAERCHRMTAAAMTPQMDRLDGRQWSGVSSNGVCRW